MRLSRTAVRRPIGTGMVFVAVIVLGVVALRELPVDLMPSVDFPRISVTTQYDGVAPEEIENLITRPIEQALSTVDGLVRLEATSAEGLSRVQLQFAWGINLETAVNDVRAQLDRLRSRLPIDANPPITYKFDLASFPVAFLGLEGSGDVRRLRYLADETIGRRLERIAGVAAVQSRGGRVREIQVLLDAERLSALEVSATEVSQALAARNRNVTAGSMLDTGREVTIRSVGEYQSLEEIAETVVAARDGAAPVRVRDVARVADGYQDLQSELWIDGRPGIRLNVRKQDDANTVEVVERLRAEIEEINREYEGVLRLRMLWDGSEFIKQSVSNVRTAALYGAGLAILVLFLFLRNARATVIIAVAIPVSVMATFALMYFAGFSLNIVSFGGIALGIGMLVDNAIVVLENIYRKREEGKAPQEAAVSGSREVGAAITASTTTTLVVFAPVLFLGGFAGVFFKELAAVVAFALICSLAVALTLVPALAGQLLGGDEIRRPRRWLGWVERALARVESTYLAVLEVALRRPFAALGLLALLLGGSCGLLRFVDAELMPEADEGRLDVSVDLPVGTPIETTASVMLDIEGRIRGVVAEDELESVITVAGPEAFWRPTGANQGSVQVNLVPVSRRSRSIDEVDAAVRRALAEVPAARVQVRKGQSNVLLRMMRRGGDRITVLIRGHDLETAEQVTRSVTGALRGVEGVTFVRADREIGMKERTIHADEQRLAELGLGHAELAAAVEHYVLGRVATRYRDRGDEVDVRVRLREEDRSRVELLDRLPVTTGRGGVVALGAVAQIGERDGPSSISREGQERVVQVFVGYGERSFGEVVADVRAALAEITIPDGFQVVLGGEAAEQEETFRGLVVGILLALFLVYAVMVVQFESLRHPFLVMGAVPFAFAGVMGVLAVTDITFNMNSFLGAIVLVGIVVNNAIVLVDYVNLLRREQAMPLLEAVKLGARRRLRPILMTTATTVLGILPLALGLGEGGELQRPLAAVVIGGLLTSAVATLLFLPTAYFLAERRRAASRSRPLSP